MIGGLIIEPAGSTWQEDSKTHASATVTKADGTKFREFVALFQDDLAALQFVNAGVTAPPSPPNLSGVSSAVNYRTEPFFYRFPNASWLSNINALAPVGISTAVTDSLVATDPQTPVFAAATNIPVRMRMLHPAGTSEEVITVHGQVWQEEPYGNNSTVIADNPFSQAAGSRDTFGANASFDLVLNHGGAAFHHPGDYLYRTFINDDFMDGMWGVVRVGDPGQDIVKIIIAVGSPNHLLVSGTNTVNTDSGKMAATVSVFPGEDATGTKIGDATVDPINGTWQLSTNVATVPAKVTVVSTEGGSYVANVSISPTKPAQGTPATNPKNQKRPPVNTDFRPKLPIYK
jgi:hypothetical protein